MEQQHLDQFSPKKKWYVYFIDFIMLFVAVTLARIRWFESSRADWWVLAC